MRLMHRIRDTSQRRGSAAILLSFGQIAVLVALVALLAIGLRFAAPALPRMAVTMVTVFYFVFIGFKLLVWFSSVRYKLPRRYRFDRNDPTLPTYTILVPVVNESRDVMRRLVIALSELVYPTDKLDILLLTESRDDVTNEAIDGIELPGFIRRVVVPDAGPQTKPKACNYGYMRSDGEMVVIYDAEDRPDKFQLLKAVSAMRSARQTDSRVACLQAKLLFWNPLQSLVATFYYAEYRTHYDYVLPGLAKLKLIPPLGGTSNHFLRSALETVTGRNGVWQFEYNDGQEGTVTVKGPWDGFNVTEDADLAMRLSLAGYRVDILNSYTYEEATAEWGKANRQRGRWIMGYVVTGLVHLRNPIQHIRDVGLTPYLGFQLFVFGTPLALLLNPVTWLATLTYVLFRWVYPVPSVTAYMESLFSWPVYYMGMIVLLCNFLLFFQNLVIPAFAQEETERHPHSIKDQGPLALSLHDAQYGLVTRLLLKPLWWGYTSRPAYRALRKILTGQYKVWDKTPHGAGMAAEDVIAELYSGEASRRDKLSPRGEAVS